jgi:3-phenylpropionate/trans-cinnamate dioxygenase ferredoxin reductase component
VTAVDLLVVGSGPGGAAAAAAYRDAGGAGQVLLLTADPHPPYARPPLSKDFLRGETDESDLPLHPDSWYSDAAVAVRTSVTVRRLDPGAHSLDTTDGEITYRRLVLALGAESHLPDVPGADHPGVLQLRSLLDGRRLRDRAAAARSAIVLGSGFIGCEAATSLALRGLSVTMVSTEEIPQQRRLGEAAARRMLGWLQDAGVRWIGGRSVSELLDGRQARVGDDVLDADLLLAATGVRPRVDLAADAGLDRESGRVLVDDRMRTSAPDVFAVGDLALAHHSAAGRRIAVEHWGDADRMGTIAGTVAAGGDDRWAQAPGFWSQLGGRTLKYAAWGDGFDAVRLDESGDGFTVWYGRQGRTVGVLTHQADDDYERGTKLVETGAALPE